MDRGTWQVTARGVAKELDPAKPLSTYTPTHRRGSFLGPGQTDVQRVKRPGLVSRFSPSFLDSKQITLHWYCSH